MIQECCDHSQTVEKVKKTLICDETLYDVAELFKAFADTTRIKTISVFMVTFSPFFMLIKKLKSLIIFLRKYKV